MCVVECPDIQTELLFALAFVGHWWSPPWNLNMLQQCILITSFHDGITIYSDYTVNIWCNVALTMFFFLNKYVSMFPIIPNVYISLRKHNGVICNHCLNSYIVCCHFSLLNNWPSNSLKNLPRESCLARTIPSFREYPKWPHIFTSTVCLFTFSLNPTRDWVCMEIFRFETMRNLCPLIVRNILISPQKNACTKK